MDRYGIFMYSKEDERWIKIAETNDEKEAIKIKRRYEKEGKTITIDYEN